MTQEELVIQQKETLCMAQEYIGKLIEGIKTSIEYLENKKETEACGLSIDIIDGISWLVEAIELTNTLHEEPIRVNEINEGLQVMQEALGNQDMTLLMDALQYEIYDTLYMWSQKIKEILA